MMSPYERKLFNCSSSVCQAKLGVVLLGGFVARVPHDAANDLWAGIRSGEPRGQCGSKRMQVGGLSRRVNMRNPSGREVCLSGRIANRSGEHECPRSRQPLGMQCLEFTKQLWMQTEVVDGLGLAFANSKHGIVKVDILPPQPAKVATAEPCKRGGHVPHYASIGPCDIEQVCQFILSHGPSFKPTIA